MDLVLVQRLVRSLDVVQEHTLNDRDLEVVIVGTAKQLCQLSTSPPSISSSIPHIIVVLHCIGLTLNRSSGILIDERRSQFPGHSTITYYTTTITTTTTTKRA
jgi:hypothetical protein